MTSARKHIEGHTDGACLGNPGPGGWAALLRWGKVERELSGGEPDTTNNRMELMAAIAALEALREPCNGILDWLANWIRRGWKTAGGDPVKNRDLWERLQAAAAPHAVDWRWVKGHSGHPENERVDQLARIAAEQYRGKTS